MWLFYYLCTSHAGDEHNSTILSSTCIPLLSSWWNMKIENRRTRHNYNNTSCGPMYILHWLKVGRECDLANWELNPKNNEQMWGYKNWRDKTDGHYTCSRWSFHLQMQWMNFHTKHSMGYVETHCCSYYEQKYQEWRSIIAMLSVKGHPNWLIIIIMYIKIMVNTKTHFTVPPRKRGESVHLYITLACNIHKHVWQSLSF